MKTTKERAEESMREGVKQLLEERYPRKPKANTVPTIRFDIPPLTTEALVSAVQNDRPIWKLLSQTALEDEAAKQAKKLSDRYDQTPIPAPEFETEDWHL